MCISATSWSIECPPGTRNRTSTADLLRTQHTSGSSRIYVLSCIRDHHDTLFLFLRSRRSPHCISCPVGIRYFPPNLRGVRKRSRGQTAHKLPSGSTSSSRSLIASCMADQGAASGRCLLCRRDQERSLWGQVCTLHRSHMFQTSSDAASSADRKAAHSGTTESYTGQRAQLGNTATDRGSACLARTRLSPKDRACKHPRCYSSCRSTSDQSHSQK